VGGMRPAPRPHSHAPARPRRSRPAGSAQRLRRGGAQDPAFLDMFLDSCNPHSKHALCKDLARDAAILLSSAAEGAADEWRESLARLGAEKQAASGAVPQLLAGFLDLASHLPVGSKSEQQLLEYISAITSRVKGLQVRARPSSCRCR